MTRLDDLAAEADAHYDAARAISQLLRGPTPAPAAYQLLGNLKSSAGHMIAHSLSELAVRLQESLSQFDVYDAKGDPAASVATANAHLVKAAQLAAAIGELLEQAQTAINSQGFNEPETAA